jgi:hypothetical protein
MEQPSPPHLAGGDLIGSSKPSHRIDVTMQLERGFFYG